MTFGSVTTLGIMTHHNPLRLITLSIMTLIIMTRSIMTLGIMTFIIMTLSILTLGIKALIIMTRSKMTLMGLRQFFLLNLCKIK